MKGREKRAMSLTIALKAIDGLVLAADSRTTEGYTLRGPKTRDNTIKFIQLKDDIGVLTYGLSEIGHEGLTLLEEDVSNNRHASLPSIIDKGMETFIKVSSDWSKMNPEIKRRDKDVGFILAGYDRGEKEFTIFNLQSPEFLPERVKGGCLIAGQWHIAKFFINRLYTRGISVGPALDLAVFLLNTTMTVEKTVGGLIRLATITKSKGVQWVSKDEVDFIIEKNKRIWIFFRELFYSTLLEVCTHTNKNISNR